MNCINLKIKLNKKLYCKKYGKEIKLSDCKNCKLIEYALKEQKKLQSRTPIKKRTSKQAKLERDRYSILTNNMKKCIECEKENCTINKHEIFGGRGRRELSIKYGLVIPLCSCSCHDQFNQRGIHFDKGMSLKWHVIGQKAFMEYYGKSVDEFREIFGKNYL